MNGEVVDDNGVEHKVTDVLAVPKNGEGLIGVNEGVVLATPPRHDSLRWNDGGPSVIDWGCSTLHEKDDTMADGEDGKIAAELEQSSADFFRGCRWFTSNGFTFF